jgi:hypothetical protein
MGSEASPEGEADHAPEPAATGARQKSSEKNKASAVWNEVTKGMRFPHFAEISSCYYCLIFRIIFC